MNKDEMIEKLRVYIYVNFRNQKQYAKARNMNPSFVSQVLNGTKEPTKKMLEEIGLSKKVVKTIKYEERPKVA